MINDDILAYILNNPCFQNGFEAIMKLGHIFATLPCSNADVERGFSCMNRTKTKLRNKFSVGRLEDLIMISLNGVDFQEQDTRESYCHWDAVNKIRNSKNI